MTTVALLHPLLFSAYAVVYIFSVQKNIMPITVLWFYLFFQISLVSLLLFLNTIIFKNFNKAAVATSIIFIFLFFFKFLEFNISSILKSIRINENLYFAFWLLLLLYLLVRIYNVKSNLLNLSKFILFLGIILLGYEIVKISAWFYHGPSKVNVDRKINLISVDKPDLFFIMLDAYANNDVLNKYYNFDNSEIIKYLRFKEFYIADKAKSNYSFTDLSIASTLNFMYINDLSTELSIIRNDRAPIYRLIDNNVLQNSFKNLGYTIVKFASGYDHIDTNNCDYYFKPLISLSTFSNDLINISPLKKFMNSTQNDLHRKRIIYIFEKLLDASKIKSPKFVFAHIPSPHPPFVFSGDGQSINYMNKVTKNFDIGDGINICSKEEYITKYAGQIQFINRQLKSLLENLLSNIYKPTIIIILGDHGPRSTIDLWDGKEASYEEAMSILMACYLPDKNYKDFYASMSPINLIRILLNSYFGINIELLKDKSYFSTINRFYDFVDVTEKMKAGGSN
jgi:hypothetical protein